MAVQHNYNTVIILLVLCIRNYNKIFTTLSTRKHPHNPVAVSALAVLQLMRDSQSYKCLQCNNFQ